MIEHFVPKILQKSNLKYIFMNNVTVILLKKDSANRKRARSEELLRTRISSIINYRLKANVMRRVTLQNGLKKRRRLGVNICQLSRNLHELLTSEGTCL